MKLKPLQLEAYFKAIEVDREEQGHSLNQLCAIHAQQVRHFDIANYQMHESSRVELDSPISIEIDDIFSKLVTERRHGYCYENNLLLYAALNSLNYDVQIHHANIHRSIGMSPLAQHLVLMVKLDGEQYLVDAGYGGVVPIPILSFRADVEQTGVINHWYTSSQSANRYQLRDETGKWTLTHDCSETGKEHRTWKPLYTFSAEPCSLLQLNEGNLSVCKNLATSPFANRIFATAFSGPSMRKGLTQDELVISESGRTLYTKPVKSAEKYLKYLHDYFAHPDNTSLLGRIPFGEHPSEACVTWYRAYKEAKRDKLSVEEVIALKKKCKAVKA